ncbi:hypothetical protein WP50_20630 [Lactiplantibacillus plantarum]|nr:hypothetical protein WP50_20630 [Lactiplantibacillus plantarum]
MPMVLMAQATKPEQLQQLQTTYPDWTFKDAAAVTAADYDQIEVMYGNHPLLKTILARPTNQLKFVQVISAGVDYLPLKALQAAGVVVANTSGIHADAISESVLAAMLSVNKTSKLDDRLKI